MFLFRCEQFYPSAKAATHAPSIVIANRYHPSLGTFTGFRSRFFLPFPRRLLRFSLVRFEVLLASAPSDARPCCGFSHGFSAPSALPVFCGGCAGAGLPASLFATGGLAGLGGGTGFGGICGEFTPLILTRPANYCAHKGCAVPIPR